MVRFDINPNKPGPEVIKPFSCSTQLSMRFQLLIKTKIGTNEEVSCFKAAYSVTFDLFNFRNNVSIFQELN